METKERKAADRLSVTEVALELAVKYQKARDLILRGKMGKAEYNGRNLTVLWKDVAQYKSEMPPRRA